MGINSVKISLKMLAIEDEKLYDMLSPKTEVTLKDTSLRVSIGCTSFDVLSVYDLHVKLMEVFHAEVTVSR
jgi:hypothetical protein